MRLLPICIAPLAALLSLVVFTPAWAQVKSKDRIEVRAGIVRLINRTELAPEDSGLLAELQVKPGDRVQAGDVLAVLQDQEAKLKMSQAVLELKYAEMDASSEAEIRQAEQNAEFRKTDWSRASAAARGNPGAFSLSELDKKKLDYDTAKLDLELALEQQQLKRAMAEIKRKLAEQAELMYERRRIRAAIAGVVERVEAQPGEWVEAGKPLVLIVNPNKLRVRGLIKVTDFDPRLEGAPARLRIEAAVLRDRIVEGTVSFVSRENEPRTDDIRVEIDFDNPDNLVRPGMRASVWVDRDELRSR